MAVPDLHGAVLTCRGEPAAVGAKGDGVDVAVVPPEGGQHLAGLHVPDLGRVLLAARFQPLPIRAECHVQTRPGRMREKSTEWFLRLSLFTKLCRVPPFDLPAAAHRSQVFSVGAEHHAPDHSLVDAERADRLTDRRAV